MAHETRSLPPAAAVLAHLRPDDLAGLRTVAVAAMATGLAIWLSLSGHLLVWAAGQLVLAVALLQWFALLHECGHATLFRTRAWHAPVGHVAAFFSLIPFHAWKRVHGRHHKWTGWQDLDPTTETLAPRARGPIERTFVNVCWRCWIPAFAVVYRLGNFWNLTRLFRTFDSPVDRRAIVRDAAALVTVYASLAIALGPSLLRVAGLAIVLSFVLQETVLLSQHTHVPQQLSGGEDVVPYPAIAQEPFTRSLRLPSWLSWLVLHFDAHELHHMYPFVPGYALRRIPYDTAHEVAWWRWTASARRLRGEVLLFQNRHDSGWEILMALDPLACALFVLTAFTIAGAAQTAWFASPWSRRLLVPLDGGRSLGGRRIFGDHKTLRGFVVMVPATAAAFACLAAWLRTQGLEQIGLWPLSPAHYAAVGAWAGLGFMAGELPNSFVKRRLGIVEGGAAVPALPRLLQFLADRLDSGVGLLAALALNVPVPGLTWAYVLGAGLLIHWSFSVWMFRLGIKTRAA